jgi:hypothetical protein
MKYWYIILLSLIPACMAAAQEPLALEETGLEAGGPFPFYPLLYTALSGDEAVFWHPAWPVDVPPDAFRSGSRAAAIRIETASGKIGLRRQNGHLTEFPAFLDGLLCQVSAAWEGEMLTVLVLDTEEPFQSEALEYDTDGIPALLRLNTGETWFFISIDRRPFEIIETWFAYADGAASDAGENTPAEPEALIMAVFQYTLNTNNGALTETNQLYPQFKPVEKRSFDSMGNITQITTPEGLCTALYNGRGLRYWNSAYMQTGENGLTLMRQPTGDASVDSIRYEYRFDERGNWIERREIIMLREGGVLIPKAGSICRRRVEY